MSSNLHDSAELRIILEDNENQSASEQQELIKASKEDWSFVRRSDASSHGSGSDRVLVSSSEYED